MKTFIIVSALFAAVFAAPPALLAPTIIAAQSPILSQYHSQDTLGQYAYGYNGGSSAKVETKSLDGVTRGSYSYIDAEGLLQTVEYTADAVNGFRAAATNLPIAPIDGVAVGRPEQVRDTPEVAQAKAEHIRAYNEAASRAAANPEVSVGPIATFSQVAPAQVLALRSAPGSFAYTINTPTGISSSWLASPQLIGSPIIAARSLQLVNGEPQDTPEVARAKAEHLQAVEEQKARIAAAQ